MRKISYFIILLLFLKSSYAIMSENKIPTRYIPRLHQSVTFLGLGTVELGRDWGIDKEKGKHPMEQTAKNVLQTAMQLGYGVVDSATSYQLSEERIGRYIPKDKYEYLLITKPGEHSITANDPRCKIPTHDNIYCKKPAAAYDFSREAIMNEVNGSLKLLKVKKIDVVMLHLDNKTAEAVLEKGEALRTLQELKNAGKISYIGVSVNGPAARIAIQKHDIDIIELEYNLLNQSNKENIDLAYAKGMGVIVRGGLATGLLTADVKQHLNDPNLPFGEQIRALLQLTNYDYKKLTALAIAFLYQNPHISTVIVGADRPEYLQEDIHLLNNFTDQPLLEQAKKILTQLPPPNDFTEIMGEHYS